LLSPPPAATAATAHHDIELPSLKSRRRCPIDAGIEVNIFLFEFNWTIVSYKLTVTKEISPRSRILHQAGDNEKCDNIHSWISTIGDLAFSHQLGIYGFKFPERFLEISS
jgi:hypothetical protein